MAMSNYRPDLLVDAPKFCPKHGIELKRMETNLGYNAYNGKKKIGTILRCPRWFCEYKWEYDHYGNLMKRYQDY